MIIFEPKPMIPMHKAYELIHSGHTIFLRPGSVFMQVVPLGTEWVVEVCYARLARNVGGQSKWSIGYKLSRVAR